MPNDNPSPSGTPSSSGGADPENNKDVVAYETYRKVLSEKKRRDEELEKAQALLKEFQDKEKERVEAELKAKGDLQKLLDLQKQEKQAIELKLKEKETLLENKMKMDAFKAEVKGLIPDQFERLIDVSKIIVDPSTGKPDPVSVSLVAREFETNYGVILSSGGKNPLPNEAANGGARKISVAEWKLLPLKEMKAKMKAGEVDFGT